MIIITIIIIIILSHNMALEMRQKLWDISYQQAWNWRGTEPESNSKTSSIYL